MAELTYHYEKLDEDGKLIYCPMNDANGKYTGKHIINLKEYFDENPEERKRLGWIKHIHHDASELLGFDSQTMYALRSLKQIDEYTVEDEIHAIEKSEEMLLFEEMYETLVSAGQTGGFHFAGELLDV